YLDIQKMVDAGMRSPSDFVAANGTAGCGAGVSTFRPSGGPPAHPAGTLVKLSNAGAVYLLRGPDSQFQQTVRLLLASPTVLQNPYNQSTTGNQFDFKDIVTIDAD